MPTNPQYSAAKHALVGLTRSCAPIFAAENITVNCICPAFVITNLAPKAILHTFPREHITPMSTVLRAFDACMGEGVTGQVVECSLGELYWRKQPEWANESQRWFGEEGEKVWDEGYRGLLPEGKKEEDLNQVDG